MYSSLKTISGFVIVLAVLNAVSAILVAMIISPLPGMEAAMFTAIIASLATCAVALLVIGIALWNLHGDMEANITSTSESLSALKKRIDSIENK